MSKNSTKLNIGDVNAWESEELGVKKYAYNTANTDKNIIHFNNLKKAVLDFNQKLSELLNSEISNFQKCSSYKTRAQLNAEIRQLKLEIENLDRAVIEIFRAYNQLRAYIVEHNFDSQKYYDLLRKQTQTQNNKLKSVK